MSAAEVIAESPAPSRDNPFKFLDYYDENDTAIFAGRAEELTTALAELTLGPTYVLYGRSGLGKTSIIKAGLFPQLTEIGYLPIYVRILDDPELDLSRAVGRALRLEGRMVEVLPQLLANVPSPDRHELDDTIVQPVILVLDQFEEFFIRFRENAALRKSFIELLGAISREGGAAVHIVFSLREDFVAELNDLRPQLPDILVRSHRLLPLTAIGAREAILATLGAHHIPYDDAVPGLIVKELERHRFSPLVLQIYCSEVFETAKHENPDDIHLRAAHVAAVGSVEKVYERYLESVTAGLAGDRALLACCMLDILRTAEETKRVLRVRDVATDATTETPLPVYFNVLAAEAEWLLNYLREKRVVRRLPTEEAWYELLHDGIVPVLTGWLQTKKDFRSFRDADRLVDNVHTMEGAYLGEKLLRMAVDPFQRLLRLTPTEIAFLFHSSVYEQGVSVAYWAQRFDETNSGTSAAQVVRTAIESSDHVIAGIVAAGRLRSAELAPLCLRHALRSPRPEVRRAAGMAYAEIGAVDFKEIKSALRKSGTHRAAIEVLADLQMAGLDLGPVGRWTRSQVERVVTRRKLSPGAELIRNRATLGTLAGLVGGLLVLATMVAPLLYLSSAILSVEFTPFAIAALICGYLAIPMLILGAWIARRAVNRAARDAVLNRTERWSRRATTAWELDLLTFAIAAWMAAAFSQEARDTPTAGALFGINAQKYDLVAHWLIHLVPAALLIVFLVRNLNRMRNAGWKLTSAEGHLGLVRAGVAFSALVIYAVAYLMQAENLAAAVLATLLIWIIMPPATSLLERVVNPDTTTLAQITFRVVQIGYLVGVLPLMLLFLVHELPLIDALRHLVADATLIMTIAVIAIATRASITAFALAWAQKQHPLSGEGILQPEEQRTISPFARALLTFSFFGTFALWLWVFDADSIPLLAGHYKAGQIIHYRFSPNFRSTKFLEIVPAGDMGVILPMPETSGYEGTWKTNPLAAEPIAISHKQPFRFALSNSDTRTKSGPGTIKFKQVLPGQHPKPKSDEIFVTLNAVCSGTGIHVSGAGPAPPLRAGDSILIELFAVGLNGDIYRVLQAGETASVESEPVIASSYPTAAFPLPVSGGKWTFAQDIAAESIVCKRPGTRGVGFAMIERNQQP